MHAVFIISLIDFEKKLQKEGKIFDISQPNCEFRQENNNFSNVISR
jgi:hypothetical protein